MWMDVGRTRHERHLPNKQARPPGPGHRAKAGGVCVVRVRFWRNQYHQINHALQRSLPGSHAIE